MLKYLAGEWPFKSWSDFMIILAATQLDPTRLSGANFTRAWAVLAIYTVVRRRWPNLN